MDGEYRIKVSVRNNLILKAIEQLNFKSVRAFCTVYQLEERGVNSFICFRQRPLTEGGEFTVGAKALMEALGACPTDLWTSEQLELKLSKAYVERNVTGAQLPIILGRPYDTLVAIESPEKNVHDIERKKQINEAMRMLTPREVKVLALRFGLDNNLEHTLEAVGDMFGVQRERVRQIEAKALRKLGHPYVRNILASVEGTDVEPIKET